MLLPYLQRDTVGHERYPDSQRRHCWLLTTFSPFLSRIVSFGVSFDAALGCISVEEVGLSL